MVDQIKIPKLTRKSVEQLFDFSKGQNTFDDPLILSQDYLETARNVRINRTGQVVTRIGQTQLGNTIHATNAATSLYEYQDGTGTKLRFVQVATKLYELVVATWTDRKDIAAGNTDFITFRGRDNTTVKSGTSTGGSINTLADTGEAWTVDAYAGKIIKNTATEELKMIESNTATVVTIEGKWDTNPGTDAYVIYNAQACGFGVNGTDKLRIRGSNAVDDITTGNWRAFVGINEHNNRLFGWLDESSRLYFSDIANGENWPTLNYIDVAADDGDNIMGGATVGALQVIVKNRSSYVLAGSSRTNFSITSLSATAGCISRRSIKSWNGVALYLGFEGVYQTDGRSEPVLVSKAMTTAFESHTQAQREDAVAGIDVENAYYMLTIDDTTYIYDIRKGAWVYDDGYEPNVFANAEDSDGAPIILIGDQGAGIVWTLESGNSDKGVSNITSVCETVKIAQGRYGFPKRYQRGRAFFAVTDDHQYVTLETNVEDEGYQISEVVDLYQDGSEWDVDDWDIAEWASPEVNIFKFRIGGRGRYVQFKWTKTDNNGAITFHGIAYSYKEKNFK